MYEIKYISDITVKSLGNYGSDYVIAAAAKVLMPNEDAPDLTTEKIDGLIGYMMKHRHGSPFENGYLSFYIHAPILVFREWMRHRIGWGYDEESARYKQLEPVFWIPKKGRPILPAVDHKSARPHYVPGTDKDYEVIISQLKASYITAYEYYDYMVSKGYAKEVARACLPVGIYSSCWVSCNPRSLMHFLSLRTHEEKAKYISYPQAEIEEAARACEEVFKEGWPITWKHWNANGRVAP